MKSHWSITESSRQKGIAYARISLPVSRIKLSAVFCVDRVKPMSSHQQDMYDKCLQSRSPVAVIVDASLYVSRTSTTQILELFVLKREQ